MNTGATHPPTEVRRTFSQPSQEILVRCPTCRFDNRPGARFCSHCRTPLIPPSSLPRDSQGALLPGVVLAERYRIVELLGAGGFGAVYRADDLRLPGRPWAIKETFDHSPEAQRQFELEARLLAHLSHPHLVKVSDYHTLPTGELFLVMDYIPGEDLEQVLQRVGGPLPEAQVLPWMLQVCDALAYLHTWRDPATGRPAPVIHRDIKPSNIKLLSDDRVMLIDLGIAKVKEPGQKTVKVARAISPPYSPLEQYGLGTDERSDIYALGATMYHLLAGVPPPAATDRQPGATLTPSALNPALSPAVEQVIVRALALTADQRYQTAHEMLQALRKCQGQPASATPETAPGVGATPLPAQPALMVQGGPWAGQIFFLAPLTTIGRLPENHVVLADGRVSRRHAEVRQQGNQYILTDLGSSNGTLVNGVRVTGPHVLREGDHVQVGDTMLVFRAAGGGPAGPYPAAPPSPPPSLQSQPAPTYWPPPPAYQPPYPSPQPLPGAGRGAVAPSPVGPARPRSRVVGLAAVAGSVLLGLVVLCVLVGWALWPASSQMVSQLVGTVPPATATARTAWTATAQAQAAATVGAETTATARAMATATARAGAIATAEAQATATARARPTATAQAAGATATAFVQGSRRLYGPASGTLDHKEDEYVKEEDAGVSVRDFAVRTRFYNPYARTEHAWDYGFGFRHTGGNRQYRLIVDSDGDWYLKLADVVGGQTQFTDVDWGRVSNLDTAAGAWNDLELVAVGETAFFFVNGRYIATLDVSAKMEHGDVWIGTGFYAGHEVNGKTTRYEDFTVWSLNP